MVSNYQLHLLHLTSLFRLYYKRNVLEKVSIGENSLALSANNNNFTKESSVKICTNICIFITDFKNSASKTQTI